MADGRVDEAAVRTIDADGLVACPGFVDPHTHYDAQLFWDPFASPSNVHGVTSVIGGNCSFGLAPLHDVDADYIRRLLAKVEGMPLVALEDGVPWGWDGFGDYLRALEGVGGFAVNAGFLLGHSALRRYVMGTEANERPATPEEIDRLRAALAAGLEAGALGFSTDCSNMHSDGDGRRVPARGATLDEVLALCEETGRHPGTTLAGIFSRRQHGLRRRRDRAAHPDVGAGQPPRELERARRSTCAARTASSARWRRRATPGPTAAASSRSPCRRSSR